MLTPPCLECSNVILVKTFHQHVFVSHRANQITRIRAAKGKDRMQLSIRDVFLDVFFVEVLNQNTQSEWESEAIVLDTILNRNGLELCEPEIMKCSHRSIIEDWLGLGILQEHHSNS